MRASDRRPALLRRGKAGSALVGRDCHRGRPRGRPRRIPGRSPRRGPDPADQGKRGRPRRRRRQSHLRRTRPDRHSGSRPDPPLRSDQHPGNPPGGVVNFTATSTDLYVDTGSQLITYTLSGAEVSAFTLPSGIVDRQGNEVSQPVIDPSGNIYLASYYDQVLDKFSPTGKLLWSVDPERRQPDRDLLGGHRLQVRAGGQRRAGQSGSDLIDLSHRGGERILPAVRRLRLRDPGVGRQPARLGQRLRRDARSDRHGALDLRVEPDRSCRGPHRLGDPVLLPGPGRAGSRRHHLHRRPPRHHRGHQPPGLTSRAPPPSARTATAAASWPWAAATSIWSAPPSSTRGDRRSTTAPTTSPPSPCPRSTPTSTPPMPRPTPSGGGPACRRRPRPTTSPRGPPRRCRASFDPWWLADASHLELSYSVENDRLVGRRDDARPHHRPAPDHRRRAGRHPPDHPGRRPTARALPGAGLALRHRHLAADAPRHHLHALHRRRHRGQPRPRQPAARHRRRRAGRPAGGGPQRPARARRACGEPPSTGAPSCPTARLRTPPRRRAARRP